VKVTLEETTTNYRSQGLIQEIKTQKVQNLDAAGAKAGVYEVKAWVPSAFAESVRGGRLRVQVKTSRQGLQPTYWAQVIAQDRSEHGVALKARIQAPANLYDGSSATIEIPQTRIKLMQLPIGALVAPTGGLTKIYSVHEGRVLERTVEVLQTNGRFVSVTADFVAGEEIMVGGQHRIAVGDLVKAVPVDPQSMRPIDRHEALVGR